jgi:hypothetical protein
MGYYTTYYAFGLPSFLVVVIALYLLFTGMINPTEVGPELSDSLQVRVKRSMSAGSSKKQALTRGRPPELVFA